MFSPFTMAAVITTGLYAGFMLTFLFAIMPGLAALSDDMFTPAMRRFNEKVPGPGFLVVFLGVIAFPAAALVTSGERGDGERLLVAGALVCALVSHLITVIGNIPLNNALASSEGGDDSAARTAFEPRWNRLHRIRTVFSLASFVLLTAVAL
ncbi:anthrone oxygenase family protein [Streptomyces sp. NPDC055749]